MGEELVEVKNKIIETSEEITPVVQFKEWVVDSDLPHIPFRQLVNKALQDVNLASVISKIEKGTEYVVKVPLEFKKAYDEGKVFVAQNSETGILRPILAKYNDKGKYEFVSPMEMVELLDEKCSHIDKLIFIKQQKIERLNQYKKSIIYEYVTGKKEV